MIVTRRVIRALERVWGSSTQHALLELGQTRAFNHTQKSAGIHQLLSKPEKRDGNGHRRRPSMYKYNSNHRASGIQHGKGGKGIGEVSVRGKGQGEVRDAACASGAGGSKARRSSHARHSRVGDTVHRRNVQGAGRRVRTKPTCRSARGSVYEGGSGSRGNVCEQVYNYNIR